MDFNYSIKNFRTFDSNGADFKVSPITILTGCNSSGKSSMVKSLLALNSFLEIARQKISDISFNPFQIPLNFYQKNIQLGDYNMVLNNKETNNDEIEFSYSVQTDYAEYPISVNLTFGRDVNNSGVYGKLKRIDFLYRDICVLSLSNNMYDLASYGKPKLYLKKVNLNPLKDDFANYIRGIAQCKYEDLKKLQKFRSSYKVDNIQDLDNFLTHNKTVIDNSFSTVTKSRIAREYSKEKKNILESICIKDIEHFFNFKSLFNIPLLDKLSQLQKTECLQELENLHKEFIDRDCLACNLKRIIEDFSKSEYETFAEYFTASENTYLSTTKEGNALNVIRSIEALYENKNYGFLNVISGAMTINFDAPDPSDIFVDDFSDEEQVIWDSEFPLKRNQEQSEYYASKKQSWFENKMRESLTFKVIVSTIADCNTLIHQNEYVHSHSDTDFLHNYGVMSSIFFEYLMKLFKKAFLFEELSNIYYLGSNKAEVKRLYLMDESTDSFDKLLVNFVDENNRFKVNHPLDVPCQFVNTWLQKFEIAHHISFETAAEGLGLIVRLHESENDKKGHLLADEGYGITQLLATMISIQLAIYKKQFIMFDDRLNPSKSHITNLGDSGYEICTGTFEEQILPSTIYVEEPEIHLHPKYQSLLADMFWSAYKQYNIHFVVETHSEYLVRKSQVLVAQMEFTDEEIESKNPFRVYYFEKGKKPRDLVYQPSGRFVYKFGSGFFDAASESALTLSKIERRKWNESK